MVGEVSDSNPDGDSSSKEPEKSDDATAFKQPEIDSSSSSSDSFEEEFPTSRTPSPVPKPPRHLIPSPARIPTLETASPVANPVHPREQYGALSIPSYDPDWYDNNLYEIQPDAKEMAEGKGEQGDKISQSGKLDLIIVHVCIV